MPNENQKHREIASRRAAQKAAEAQEIANSSFTALEPGLKTVETDLSKTLKRIIEVYGEDAGIRFLRFLDSAVNFPNTNLLTEDTEKGALFLETIQCAMQALIYEVSTGSNLEGIRDRQMGIANNPEDFVAEVRTVARHGFRS